MWTDGVMTFLRPNKLWRLYVGLILLSYWAMSASILPETSFTVSACRGEYFSESLSCPGGIIAVGSLAYVYKNYFDTQLNDLCYNNDNFNSTCCTVDIADCQIDVEDLPDPTVQGQVELIYQFITGKSIPSVEAADVTNDICYLNEDVTDPQQSHYMQIQYYCIPDERIVNITATNSDLTSRTNSDGYALYLYNDPFVAGTCSVEVDSCTATLEMYTIALNLASDSNGCQHSINVTEGDVTKTLTCDDNTKYIIQNSTATSNYVVITFYGSNAVGENVEAWVGFRAPDGTPLHVNCPAVDQVYCKHCLSPSIPTNGAVDTSGGTEYNDVATFSCDTGYSPDATQTTICQADATWTTPTHTCTIKDCLSPSIPTDGAVDTSNGTEYNDVATFSCNTGYSPDATQTTTCQNDTTWTTPTHTCTIKDCLSPLTPTNGTVDTSDGTEYNNVATFSCDTGYSPVAAQTTTCQANTTWTTPTHTCTITDCGTPTNPTNGSISLVGGTGATVIGNTATVTCNSGYKLSTDTTSETITCQADGSWTTIPTCASGFCDDPSPTHGKATGPFTYPSTADITCDQGYNRHGEATISCLATGAWSSNTTCGGEGVRIRSQLSLITGLVAAYILLILGTAIAV